MVDTLRRQQIVCGTRNNGVRVSIAAYNEEQDIAALMEAFTEQSTKSI